MGALWSLLGYPDRGRTDDPDPTTGLTSRDRYNIKTSWARIMQNPTDNGVALLTLYFEKFPEAKELFPFKDTPTTELAKSIGFKVHCNVVIYAVASIVDAIESIELLVSILEKIGSSHAPRGVTTKLFLQLEETMLELFDKIMNADETDSWKKALNVVFSVINKSLTERLNQN